MASVTSDLNSEESVRQYAANAYAFKHWLGDRIPDKQTLGEYKQHLRDKGYSPSTINSRLIAVRAILRELAATRPDLAPMLEHAAKIKGVRAENGLGNWLTLEGAQAMLDAPDTSTLKGLRDKAILGLLFLCGLRRSEVARLQVSDIQQREGHWVISDLISKHNRKRTIKVPVSVKRAIDAWVEASSVTDRLFVSIRKGGKISEDSISDVSIYRIVRYYAEMAGISDVSAHDTRRTFAKLARKGGCPVEVISQALGHKSLDFTLRYLGMDLELDHAACDYIRLNL